jgi:hypothetical protein
LRRDDFRVPRFFQITRQRPFDTSPAIRLSRPETRRPVVLMCVPLARGIRGKPSPTRGLARHSRGRSCPLLTRRSQTLCSGPVVTARKMGYFEEGHHDRRTDRRSQLMKFVAFHNKSHFVADLDPNLRQPRASSAHWRYVGSSLPNPPMGNEHSGKLTNIGIVLPFVRGHSCALILY